MTGLVSTPPFCQRQKTGNLPYQQDRVVTGVVTDPVEKDIAQTLLELIRQVDHKAQINGRSYEGGSTASIIALLNTGVLVSVHVGDSPIFVFEVDKNNRYICSDAYLFTPHDVSNEQQMQALREKGHNSRIEGRFLHSSHGGMISITNSIGDCQFDLLCDPEITISTLPKDSPSVIVVASDGVLEGNASQTTYVKDVCSCMADYSIENASDTAEFIATSILSKSAEIDNCTVLATIFDPKCDYQHALVAAVFDGHFSDAVAELAVTEFRTCFTETY